MLSADIIIFLNAKQAEYTIIINSEDQRGYYFRKLITQQVAFMLKNDRSNRSTLLSVRSLCNQIKT